MSRRIRRGPWYKFAAVTACLLLGGFFILQSHSAKADFIPDYQPANLISDYVFTDTSSMDQTHIDNFLQGLSSNLASSTGYTASVTCDMWQHNNFSTYCGQQETAAWIINQAAQVYQISPRVLLATMQKEQSLVTMPANADPSTLSYARNCATGYFSCSSFQGFFNQVVGAARQFRIDINLMSGQNFEGFVPSQYPCGGATSLYSTGLYPGNTVTFTNSGGSTMRTITLANTSTASLYCYTPYVGPKYDTGPYVGTGYSGSYNFVYYFDLWFGSTQPALEVTSPLTVSSAPEGAFAGVPTTASFTMFNSTTSAISANVAVMVRDAQGGNHDYGLQTITVPARGSATYSATQTFSAEGSYTFGITSYTSGVWNTNYPVSSNFENPRSVTANLLMMPTITVGPASSISSLHIGQTTNMTFTVKNNSAQAMSIGKVALAMRGPEGQNEDLALVDPGTLPAGGQYTYSRAFTPSETGGYNAFITTTVNNGTTWDPTYFPATVTGVSRNLSFTVLPNPTITVSPALSLTSPRVGQAVNATFTVHNYGSSPVSIGTIALVARDPSGVNSDFAAQNSVTIQSGQDYTYSASRSFSTPGTYTAWIADYSNGVWNGTDYPAMDSTSILRKITFTVLPSPTLTQGPVLSVNNLRVGQNVTGSFKVKNYGDGSVNVGQIGIAVRDTNGNNVDFGSVNLNLAAGQEYIFQMSRSFATPGTYTAWVTDYHNGAWDDTTYPTADSASILRKITFTVLPSPTITVSPTLDDGTPRVGQNVNATFTIHNYGSTAVNVGSVALALRDPNGSNVDCSLQPATIQPGQDLAYSCTKAFSIPGSYTGWIADLKNGDWNSSSYPVVESSGVSRILSFTVLPSPTITQGPTLSIASPQVGQNITATFVVHNYGSTAVDVGGLALALRDPTGKNVDCSLQTPTIQPGQDYIYTCPTVFNTAGTYTGWVADLNNGVWNITDYPALDNINISRNISFTVSP